jgi:hypothetical protein
MRKKINVRFWAFVGMVFSLVLVLGCTYNSKLPDSPQGGSNRVDKEPSPAGTVMVDGGDSVLVLPACIANTPDQGLLFGGRTIGSNLGTVLVKTDSAGHVLMVKKYSEEDSSLTYIENIIPDYDNGYLLAYKAIVYNRYFIKLIKVDNGFNQVWQHVIYAEDVLGNATAISYAVSNDYGVWVTGRSLGPIDSLGIANSVLWVYKINKNNDTVVSKKNIDTTIKSTSIITGCIENRLFIISPSYANAPKYYKTDIIKVDELGNILWRKEPDWSLDFNPSFLSQTKDNKLALIGYNPSDINKYDRYVLEADAEGNALWYKDFPHSYNGDGGLHNFFPLSDGSTIVVGDYDNPNSDYPDVWLFKLNTVGDTVWSRTYGGKNEDYGMAITKTLTGNLMVAAKTSSYGTENDDLWLFKTDSNGIMIPLK